MTPRIAVLVGLLLGLCPSARAQLGGVKIDAEGILSFDAKQRRAKARPVDLPAELAARSDLRRVSLRDLDALVRASLQAGGDIPDELRLMAGLTSIDYVIFESASRDILLAGPAEGWKIDGDGREVGIASGRAVLHLEDLALALRTVLNGPGTIECSLDPTKEGLAAVQAAMAEPLASRRDAPAKAERVRNALGMQRVRIGGVPPGSRFGRTMVEADYLMKQVAIGALRIKGVSNHLDALVERSKAGDSSISLARWWFSADYDPPASDESHSIYKILGPRIQLFNEEMMVDREGNRAGKGDASRQDRFSSDFTQALPDLQTKYPVLADLRNLFDMVFVAALARHRGVADWLEGSVFLDVPAMPIPEGIAPKEAEPVATFELHRAVGPDGKPANTMTLAFGGVFMNPAKMIGTGTPGEAPAALTKADLPPLLDQLGETADDVASRPRLESISKGEGAKDESRAVATKSTHWWADIPLSPAP